MKQLKDWVHVGSGKVRDMYVPATQSSHTGEDLYLIVASDRISAYDYVLPTLIPDKGEILTQLSLWWFERLASIVPTHVVSTDVPEEVRGRAFIARRVNMFPVECWVRGYLAGDAYTEYLRTQSVQGVQIGRGKAISSQLENPIFSPYSKAKRGGHDVPLTFVQAHEAVGEIVRALRSTSLFLYRRAFEIAREKGVIIADTKFEFGQIPDDNQPTLVLADEVLTPDSSRFWLADGYRAGAVQPSFDKQFVRDCLKIQGWDPRSGQTPPPLPDEVVEKTRDRYIQIYETLTGCHWQ